MGRAFLGLGSNLGDRLKYLCKAADLIKNTPGIALLKCSHIYETQPVGLHDQGDFLNAVVEINCRISSENLLRKMQEAEQALGRTREIKWGPRTIDIDILSIESLYYNSPRLKVPHPELENRLFVLQPFNDIAAKYLVFGLDKTVHQLLKLTTNKTKVRFYMSSQALLNKPKEVLRVRA